MSPVSRPNPGRPRPAAWAWLACLSLLSAHPVAAQSGEPEAPIGAAAAETLIHAPISEGQRGSAISVSVVVKSALAFDRLVLAYHGSDSDSFLGRRMDLAGSETYTAEIPASATGGATVSYFIEALTVDGRVVAARGSAERPLVIALLGDATIAAGARGDVDQEAPQQRIWIALTAGSGVGLTSGTGDLNADATVHTRLAPARLFHLSPEAGYWVSRSLLLSLQARVQFVSGTTDLIVGDQRYRAAGRAAALFARAAWLYRARRDFQPLFSLALGAGQIRHVTAFDFFDCGDDHRQRCVDTVTAGPLLAGAGTGFFYWLGEAAAIVAQLNAQLGAPHATLNVDLNLGAAVRF
ncbi:MAG TPA: hypothetical protein VMU50_19460 [Polyangia bacterium]|nr:hypothetical protein [Polyangia bacterium]